MSTSYPGSKQTLANPAPGDVVASALLGQINDTVEALQDEVGTTTPSSGTLRKRVADLEAAAGGGAVSRCLLYKTGTQSLTNSSTINITWNQEDSDPSGWHDTVTNNQRITVPSAGVYYVDASVMCDAFAGTGACQIWIYKNGSALKTAIIPVTNAASARSIPISATLVLAASDYLEIRIQQNSGGAVNTSDFSTFCWFQVVRLGAAT